MRKLLLALVVLAPSVLLADSVFDGTWRFNPQTAQFGGKPDSYSLQKGMYKCESCAPKVEVKADGNDHPRSGSPYSDTINVKEVDDHTVEIASKKGGKVVGTSKLTASADGKMLTVEWSFISDNGQEGHGKAGYTRIAAAPAGANQISGTWKPEKVESISDSASTVTYKMTGDSLSMSDPSGDSYDAKLDGKDYPYKGDPGTTSVSLKRIDANTIEETDKRNGKVISVSRMKVSADGQTMTMDVTDKLHGTTAKFEAKKR